MRAGHLETAPPKALVGGVGRKDRGWLHRVFLSRGRLRTAHPPHAGAAAISCPRGEGILFEERLARRRAVAAEVRPAAAAGNPARRGGVVWTRGCGAREGSLHRSAPSLRAHPQAPLLPHPSQGSCDAAVGGLGAAGGTGGARRDGRSWRRRGRSRRHPSPHLVWSRKVAQRRRHAPRRLLDRPRPLQPRTAASGSRAHFPPPTVDDSRLVVCPPHRLLACGRGWISPLPDPALLLLLVRFFWLVVRASTRLTEPTARCDTPLGV